MSLGFMQGNTWVIDTRFAACAELEPYKKLVTAAARDGFGWRTEFSYTARRYTTEIQTIHTHANGKHSIVSHENAFDPHPLVSIVEAIRRHGTNSPLVTVLCIELELIAIREKLLPMKRLETALEDLADTIILARLK